MNAAERMTVLCADRRKRAGERGDSESWEVWEDLEDLFRQVARVLENEPEATVRPFMSGMARALAATAAYASRWHHTPAVMADWIARRDRTSETPGETCAYGDLMVLRLPRRALRQWERHAEHPERPRPVRRGGGVLLAYQKERMMAKRNEPTKEQVEAAAGFLRDNLHLFGPQACFLETGHIDEIAYGMLRAAGKAAH